MKYAIVIEDDLKLFTQISEAILLSDSSIVIRHFLSYQLFNGWLKSFDQDGAAALVKAGASLDESLKQVFTDIQFEELKKSSQKINRQNVPSEHLILLVAKYESFGDHPMQVITDLISKFTLKNVCTTDQPTAIVVTGFDDPKFKIKQYENILVSNIVYKPFDRLILLEHIRYALTGRQPVREHLVHSQATSATIEMLKEIQMEHVTETGFITRSDQAIPAGAIGKYYSEYFVSPKLKSTIAICTTSVKNPQNPKEFLCFLRYYGIENDQLTTLRKVLKDFKAKPQKPIKKTSVRRELNIVAIEAKETQHLSITQSIERIFKGARSARVNDIGTFLAAIEKAPVPIDCVLLYVEVIDAKTLQNTIEQAQEKIRVSNQKTRKTFPEAVPFFIFSPHHVDDNAKKLMATYSQDLFFTPVDRSYVLKRFYAQFPDMDFNEDSVEILESATNAHFKSATPVKLTEISEAGIKMEYGKKMSIGGFREFVLGIPGKENQTPELIAFCNFLEESQADKEKMIHYFCFFGMRDEFLKHIRLWIRDMYILGKERG